MDPLTGKTFDMRVQKYDNWRHRSLKAQHPGLSEAQPPLGSDDKHFGDILEVDVYRNVQLLCGGNNIIQFFKEL